MICPFCKEEIPDGSIRCTYCGSMLNVSQADPPQHLAGSMIGLLGSMMMIAGIFLPWAMLGTVSVSGWAKAEGSKTLLVLGIAIALFSILGLAAKKIHSLFVLLGLASLGMLAYQWYSLQKYLCGSKALAASARIGWGFWLSFAGAVVVLLGAAAMRKRKPR